MEFSDIKLSENQRNINVRVPKRVLHFSDGVLEEYSDDETDNTPPKTQQVVDQVGELPKKLIMAIPWYSLWILSFLIIFPERKVGWEVLYSLHQLHVIYRRKTATYGNLIAIDKGVKQGLEFVLPIDGSTVVKEGTLPWGPWLIFKAWAAGTSTLAAIDYMGEFLADFFGITTPKYQSEIDEYERIEARRKEAEEMHRGWTEPESSETNILEQPMATRV